MLWAFSSFSCHGACCESLVSAGCVYSCFKEWLCAWASWLSTASVPSDAYLQCTACQVQVLMLLPAAWLCQQREKERQLCLLGEMDQRRIICYSAGLQSSPPLNLRCTAVAASKLASVLSRAFACHNLTQDVIIRQGIHPAISIPV